MTHNADILAALRRSIAEVDSLRESFAAQNNQGRLNIGVSSIDALLGGGLALNDVHELRCSLSRDIGCIYGFLFVLLTGLDNSSRIIWISDSSIALDAGRIFPDGLACFGFNASRLIHVHPMQLNDCLWAVGEATRTRGPAAVIFHVRGNPKGFDLPASRKLMLRAQSNGAPLFILRQAGKQEASSAATRWHIAPASSLSDETYRKGLGHMRLVLTLEKNRSGQTGQWTVAWNPKTRSFEHAASTYSQLSIPASADRSHSPAAMGQVVALERAS